ncbi:MAG: enoyl-CoA hydratase/isomerase family protein [Emcibacteraceae bacterium]|nr:enoyl-CoA hydratase/isomerase family protein [Emcibacteraceae bacterium]
MTIIFEKTKNVARITLNRPKVHNAFNQQMIVELTAAFADLESCPNTDIVLISGAGASFSAGADLEWMKLAAGYSYEENIADAMKLSNMFDALYRLKQLTIACVHGANMGGAIGLISSSDIVFADQESKFALSEVKLGLTPATISPYVINAIGARQAKRYFQTGELFNAEKALEIGLIHEIFTSEDDREGLIDSLLYSIRHNAPNAMKNAKKLVIDYNNEQITDDLRRDSAMKIAKTRSSEEAAEGLSAFFDKRKPDWKNDV